MLKPIFVGALLLSLASCTGFGIQKTNTDNSGEVVSVSTGTTNTGSNETMDDGDKEAGTTYTEGQDGAMMTLNYTLRADSEDGEILETTVESVAKENGIYTTGAIYQPFTTFLGQKQVIEGFEEGLMGMKAGDTKIIIVPPEKGYGTGETLTPVSKTQIAPEFEITQDIAVIEDTITDTVAFDQFSPEIQSELQSIEVGGTFTGAGIDATIKAKTETGITLEFPNTQNPFYGKEKKVGTQVSNELADYTITALTETGVTIAVVNKQSPFYGKEFVVGSEVEIGGMTIVIRGIDEDTVTIGQMHPLAGKTLYFDVEVLDVK